MASITFKEILDLRYNLAPSQLTILEIPNKNTRTVAELLDRKLRFSDNGNEVGSKNYISNSTHFFVRAKALQEEYFIPVINKETAIPIRPQVFLDYELKEGDLIISKDSNIGEAVILDKDYLNYTISGALYKLPISKYKYYLFSFLKHRYFRNQLDLLVPKGSTIRHAKTLFLDCKIPFPEQRNAAEVIQYVEVLTQAIINKEKVIRRKNKEIFELIKLELSSNQQKNQFNYEKPSYDKVLKYNRIDAEIYSEYFSKNEFLIKNYKFGYKNVKQLDFKVNRGQNLQVSCIGKSIFSNEKKEGFYKVIKPMHISAYGINFSEEYLGNPKKLKTLKEGDIIFGAEGFEKGRSMVIFKDDNKTITNIHGITLNHRKKDIKLSIFVKCFLDYLREVGLIDIYAVGGNGGSLAMKYWDIIPFPNFPLEKQNEISFLYSNKVLNLQNITIANFLDLDKDWTNQSGIVEIDKSIKFLKQHLNNVLDQIINSQDIVLDLNFKYE